MRRSDNPSLDSMCEMNVERVRLVNIRFMGILSKDCFALTDHLLKFRQMHVNLVEGIHKMENSPHCSIHH